MDKEYPQDNGVYPPCLHQSKAADVSQSHSYACALSLFLVMVRNLTLQLSPWRRAMTASP